MGDGGTGEKTEEPTPQKIKQARDKGQVSKSQDAIQAMLFVGVFSVLALTIGDLPEEEWFSDPDVIDGSYSSYAGRDCDQFPLRNTSGKDCWVATDNDGGMNFRTTTLMLMGDGAVERLETYTLIEEGVLDEGEEILFVGPDSQHEELRKLSLD